MTTQASTEVARGGCLCGEVRFRVHGALRDVLVCHCGQCRRQHTIAGAYTACADEALVIECGAALAWYQSSETAKRGFCTLCGAGLFWKAVGSDRTSVAVGSLDAEPHVKLAGHLYAAEKSPHFAVVEESPAWSAGAG